MSRSLRPDSTLYDVVQAIERSRRRAAVVTAEDGRLLGMLTDGDVRRCLLAGGTLDTPASEVMNPAPVAAQEGSSDSYLFDLMKRANAMTVPLVDGDGVFVRLVHLSELSFGDETSPHQESFEAAVIMAGGEGTRLRPLTQDIPKPMIEIEGVPLLERQIRSLRATGVRRVYLSVNYLSHIIEDHFGDGSSLGLEIHYLREKKKLGTAGALSLLPEPVSPIIVMNGDILTTSDFANLYSYHDEHQAAITVSAIDYNVQIPFGVLRVDGHRVTSLEEKPSQRFLCNAGIYALSKPALELIPEDTYYDMTQLVRDCLDRGREVAVFPVHEYWSDIGTSDDLEKARQAFSSMNWKV